MSLRSANGTSHDPNGVREQCSGTQAKKKVKRCPKRARPLILHTSPSRPPSREAAGGAHWHRRWAIAEGYIPSWSNGPEPQFTSHETACLLNAGDEDAHVEVQIYFEDRGRAGPYTITVPARRTKHVRFNELTDPEPIPSDTDYASVISSDVPLVVQHTQLDSRQAENALLSTIAYASNQ